MEVGGWKLRTIWFHFSSEEINEISFVVMETERSCLGPLARHEGSKLFKIDHAVAIIVDPAEDFLCLLVVHVHSTDGKELTCLRGELVQLQLCAALFKESCQHGQHGHTSTVKHPQKRG